MSPLGTSRLHYSKEAPKPKVYYSTAAHHVLVCRLSMNYKSLFETLGAGALLALCGCSELRLPLGNLAPPSPTVNTLPKYYRANPAMPEQPQVYGVVDVSYRLVDWKDVASVQNEYSRKGYVQLGQCDFAAQTGAPLQQNAVDFARYLGADLVVYAIRKTAGGDTRHYIDFLARTRESGGLTADRS
jgi:hypothetical protein